MINKNNYEQYFLDYHEGNLPAELVAELFLFLSEHPEMKAEFDEFEKIELPPAGEIVFHGKDFLKKGTIHELNYTQFLIGKVENMLDADELTLLQNYLEQHPELKQELILFEKTKLQPDQAIVYSGKEELKKVIPLFAQPRAWYFVAAAACILLLLGVFFINQENQDTSQRAERGSNPVEIAPPSTTFDSVKREDKGGLIPEHESLQKEILLNGHDSPGLLADKEKNSRDNDKKINSKGTTTKISHANREHVTFVQPLLAKLYAEPAKVTLAGHTSSGHQAGYTTIMAEPQAQAEYLTVSQVLLDYSKSRIQNAIDDKPLAAGLFDNQSPGKVKRIRFLGWCLGKVTGEQVDLHTTYNSWGELTAYQVSAGRLQFGKTFASR